jgi:hypothetical protein
MKKQPKSTHLMKKNNQNCGKHLSSLSIIINNNDGDDGMKRVTPHDIDRYMNHLTHEEEYRLALHIATALGEPNNVDYYLRFTGVIPKDYLLEKLAYVLSAGEIENKAAYYNSILKSYGGKNRGYRRG